MEGWVSLDPSRSRCQDTVKHVRILIRGGRLGEFPDITSDAKAGREVWVEASQTVQSKEGLRRPLGNPGAKVSQWRDPCVPEQVYLRLFAGLSHWLGAALGECGLDINTAIDFRAEAPWSIILLIIGGLQGIFLRLSKGTISNWATYKICQVGKVIESLWDIL